MVRKIRLGIGVFSIYFLNYRNGLKREYLMCFVKEEKGKGKTMHGLPPFFIWKILFFAKILIWFFLILIMREETLNWWKQSEKDLKAAKNSLNSGDYEWASFQANQGAEKALKALFLEKKKAIVPTHNLISLGRSLNLPDELINSLKELNPEYTLARYPDAANAAPFENYTKEKAKKQIENAERVLKWTRKQLKL